MPGLLEEIVRAGLLAKLNPNGSAPTPPNQGLLQRNSAMPDDVVVGNLPPPPGSPAYIPPNPEMLEMFPHESTFGQALSSKYIFPVQRIGSTGEVREHARTGRSNYGETNWRWPGDPGLIDLNISPPPPEEYFEHRGEYSIGPEGYRVMPAWPTEAAGGRMGFFTSGHQVGGHHERVPSFEERREAYRQKMIGTAKHEAAHRERKGPGKHEEIYLLQWVDGKLRGDKETMDLAQSWLNHGVQRAVKRGGEYVLEYERKGKEPYDIIAALQPGAKTRGWIDKWNDKANQELISEGRPPILNYRDYINKAIGYSPKKGDSKTQGGTP